MDSDDVNKCLCLVHIFVLLFVTCLLLLKINAVAVACSYAHTIYLLSISFF